MRSLPRAALSLSLVLPLFAASPARAQSLDGLSPSARVRVDILTSPRSRFHRERVQSLVGSVDAIGSDTLSLVVQPGAAVRVPRSAIHQVYLSGGRPPRWEAALRGAVVPALLGAAVSAISVSAHRGGSDLTPAQAAASSAAWGAASGAILAAWSPRERWRRLGKP